MPDEAPNESERIMQAACIVQLSQGWAASLKVLQSCVCKVVGILVNSANASFAPAKISVQMHALGLGPICRLARSSSSHQGTGIWI